LAIPANAIRQGKEIRALNMGGKVKTFVLEDRNKTKDY
jgi:hypothetical protein